MELIPQKKGKDVLFYRLKLPVQQISKETFFEFKFVTQSGDWLDVLANAPNAVTNSDRFVNLQLNPQQTGKHIFRLRMPTNYVPVGNEMLVWREPNYEEKHELSNIQFLLSVATQLPLGAIVEKDRTVFRLFAPRAGSVKLVYGYQADESDAITIEMRCMDGVTWEIILLQCR